MPCIKSLIEHRQSGHVSSDQYLGARNLLILENMFLVSVSSFYGFYRYSITFRIVFKRSDLETNPIASHGLAKF